MGRLSRIELLQGRCFQERSSRALEGLKVSRIEKPLEHLLYSLRGVLLILQHEVKGSDLLKPLADLQLCTTPRN